MVGIDLKDYAEWVGLHDPTRVIARKIAAWVLAHPIHPGEIYHQWVETGDEELYRGAIWQITGHKYAALALYSAAAATPLDAIYETATNAARSVSGLAEVQRQEMLKYQRLMDAYLRGGSD